MLAKYAQIHIFQKVTFIFNLHALYAKRIGILLIQINKPS